MNSLSRIFNNQPQATVKSLFDEPMYTGVVLADIVRSYVQGRASAALHIPSIISLPSASRFFVGL